MTIQQFALGQIKIKSTKLQAIIKFTVIIHISQRERERDRWKERERENRCFIISVSHSCKGETQVKINK